MRTQSQLRAAKVGLPPGTLLHPAENKTSKTNIKQMHYNETQIDETQLGSVDI